jgi:hypothetical protein
MRIERAASQTPSITDKHKLLRAGETPTDWPRATGRQTRDTNTPVGRNSVEVKSSFGKNTQGLTNYGPRKHGLMEASQRRYQTLSDRMLIARGSQISLVRFACDDLRPAAGTKRGEAGRLPLSS